MNKNIITKNRKNCKIGIDRTPSEKYYNYSIIPYGVVSASENRSVERGN